MDRDKKGKKVKRSESFLSKDLVGGFEAPVVALVWLVDILFLANKK